jgi:hypothetical protein
VISEAMFFGIVFQGNPCRSDAGGRNWLPIGRQLHLRFSQLRTTTPVQKIAPRKITGAGNVTRKAVFSNGTIELSRFAFRREPEMQQDACAW